MTRSEESSLAGLNNVVGTAVRNGNWPQARRSLARAGDKLRAIEEHDERWRRWRGVFLGHWRAVQTASLYPEGGGVG